MFTLLVSWLLVACVPGLVMLATLGLGRLEKELTHDTVSVTDVAEFLEHAEAVDVDTLAREGMTEALAYLHKRQAERLHDLPPPGSHPATHHAPPFLVDEFGDPAEAGPPAPVPEHSRVNPQFNATQHVDRV
ncbi:hypothetical protein B586_03980 [Mycobacterium haemophilum DSM 44634]|uniref:hypothetical protein n=1 Tax=Mycobacterium haemophilum TaxID=29311 RepID=UPI0006550849|nr:hypothetical protein [Mycobacterium haemophilum]AKN15909.1 hypothetical protein B586_03980 [Mycobacterium haemophilum DSM 44634]MCV7339168.1 hypothetical protein [Mycobacterium haemophilum DSM 44634]